MEHKSLCNILITRRLLLLGQMLRHEETQGKILEGKMLGRIDSRGRPKIAFVKQRSKTQ